MTDKVTMYPTKVTQPNRNKASGLQGKCFKAVRRNGTSYEVNCRDQRTLNIIMNGQMQKKY